MTTEISGAAADIAITALDRSTRPSRDSL
jgi:hypothetical protein